MFIVTCQTHRLFLCYLQAKKDFRSPTFSNTSWSFENLVTRTNPLHTKAFVEMG